MKCEDLSPFFTLQTSFETSPILRLVQRLKDGVGKVSRAIANQVTHGSEPTVRERCDRRGNVYYQVYDPRTQKSAVFGCQSEVRYWLEQRYAR
jgi:hypothetical protein